VSYAELLDAITRAAGQPQPQPQQQQAGASGGAGAAAAGGVVGPKTLIAGHAPRLTTPEEESAPDRRRRLLGKPLPTEVTMLEVLSQMHGIDAAENADGMAVAEASDVEPEPEPDAEPEPEGLSEPLERSVEPIGYREGGWAFMGDTVGA
jgi:hypothetical protein